jgi:selenium metabolism protein YedF
MKLLDCRGQSCPLPVLDTKKLIEEESPKSLQVVVDSEVPRDNVRRFLESRGYVVTVEPTADGFLVLGSLQIEESVGHQNQEKRLVAFIDGETLGRGNDQLGRILMRSFVITLKELKPLPWRMIFINGGAKLVSEGSELITYLTELEDLGVEIISCGTCLDFFSLKEKLRVGRASNMYEILSTLAESTSILKP